MLPCAELHCLSAELSCDATLADYTTNDCCRSLSLPFSRYPSDQHCQHFYTKSIDTEIIDAANNTIAAPCNTRTNTKPRPAEHWDESAYTPTNTLTEQLKEVRYSDSVTDSECDTPHSDLTVGHNQSFPPLSLALSLSRSPRSSLSFACPAVPRRRASCHVY